MPITDRLTVSFVLNGQSVSVDVEPSRSLLEVLREDLDLTGTKQACDCEGECGACTVLLDGEAVRSCLTPIGKVAGRRVMTIEGLGTAGALHPLQQAVIDYGAVQCGFCTPGMIMSTAALLGKTFHPSREEILAALDGNLCRCTGYNMIAEAVEAAAAVLRGEEPQAQRTITIVDGPEAEGFIGGSQLRVDAVEKVTGTSRFAEDIKMAGMVYAAVARSQAPHARVRRIDTRPALNTVGVLRVLTAEDIPGVNELAGYSRDEHLLAGVGDTVRMIGDALALVVADSEEAARSGAEAVYAELEPLPHTFDVQEAAAPGTTPIHAGGNELSCYELIYGEPREVFTASDLVLETLYETAFNEHCAMERETVLSYVDEGGVITVISGNQEPHWAQGFIASVMGTSPQGIRVITPPTGGAFGGKQDPWPLIAGALCAHHVRRPVRLTYSRKESFQASPKRHPYRVAFRVGARNDGNLTALHLRILGNTGAYDSAGYYIPQYAVVAGGGPYRWQAVDAKAQTIYTNGPKAGQMRGFGTPQSIFALECTLDELAVRLGMDPLELRVRNAVDEETTLFLGYPPAERLAYGECLKAIEPLYREALQRAEERNRDNGPSPIRCGVGLAGMWYRFGKSGAITCEAHAELGLDGRITIFFSAPDYGQGTLTVMSQLAAEAFGVGMESIRLVNADTALTPDSGIQGASRSTYWVGGAVAVAARSLKNSILGVAAEMLDAHPDSLWIVGEEILSPQGRRVSLKAVAQEMGTMGLPLKVPGIFAPAPSLPEERPEYLPFFVSGAHCAEVAVNLESGDVDVLRIVAVHDIGRAINPQSVRGQVEGSIVMGLGAALMEEYIPDASAGFRDYSLPTIRSAPEIEIILVERPGRWGPHGAKGLGEAAILASTPAIINGIYRASGARIRRLPATTERVRRALALHASTSLSGT